MTLDRAAERSFIGAVLLDPSQLDDITDWLTVEDFDGTAEAQAFAAVLALKDRGERIAPESVDAMVRATVPSGTQLADAAFLVEVIQETPEPGRAAIYGRMVLELSIRRHVGASGIELRQRAEQASSAEELNQVFGRIDGYRRSVEALHLRESRADVSHSVAPATDENLPQLTRFPRYEELAAEQLAIVSLVDKPAALEHVGKWLRSSDFGDEETGALFSELVALHEARNPIDRVTVAWRAAKVDIRGPVTDALASGRNLPPTTDAVEASRRVLEQSVRAAMIATSEQLEAVTDERGASPTTVAYTRLNRLWPQQRRLVRARMASIYEWGSPSP